VIRFRGIYFFDSTNQCVLYVNGALVATGLQSSMNGYFAPTALGKGAYGDYFGGMDEVCRLMIKIFISRVQIRAYNRILR
jgi:hypothetical protein